MITRVDDPRSPDVVAETARLGIRSLLCLRLGAAGHPLGALTVYGSAPAVFLPGVQRLGHAFAAIAAIALSADRARADQGGGMSGPDGGPSQSVSSVRARCFSPRAGTGPGLGGFAAAGES